MFDSNQLKDCPSAQLQIVGEMAEEGRVAVNVMGGTIVYSVDQKRKQTDLYDLQVLTIAANFKC